MIRVAIGIPVYNGEIYLKEAIESAIDQSESADEIVVFEHDSIDRSLAIAQSFEPKVRVVHENSCMSIGAAWNAIYEHSSCDYVVMLHADDFLAPDAIATIKSTIARDRNIDIIFGSWRVLENGKVIEGIVPKPPETLLRDSAYTRAVLQDGYLPPCSGTCIRRSTIAENGFRQDFEVALDFEFFIRASWIAQVSEIATNLATYRIHQDSTLQNKLATEKIRRDLSKWWDLLESKEIVVPDEILPVYRASLFRRIVHAFLHDLWGYQRQSIAQWLNLMQDAIDKYPCLTKSAFTSRSLALYKLAALGRVGCESAALIAWLGHKYWNNHPKL